MNTVLTGSFGNHLGESGTPARTSIRDGGDGQTFLVMCHCCEREITFTRREIDEIRGKTPPPGHHVEATCKDCTDRFNRRPGGPLGPLPDAPGRDVRTASGRGFATIAEWCVDVCRQQHLGERRGQIVQEDGGQGAAKGATCPQPWSIVADYSDPAEHDPRRIDRHDARYGRDADRDER